jgi:hypothetical protein
MNVCTKEKSDKTLQFRRRLLSGWINGNLYTKMNGSCAQITVYKFKRCQIINIITVNTTLFNNNLLVLYKYSYAVCFDHDFGHHQALNEHISSNQTHWIQYGSVFVNRLLCSEYIMKIYSQSTIMIKKV